MKKPLTSLQADLNKLKKLYLICSFCVLSCVLSSKIFALDFPEMPSISGVSVPSMPTISSGEGSGAAQNGNANGATQNSASQNATTQSNSASKVNGSSLSSSLAGYGLTASTISGLSSLSGLNTLSGLLGDDSSNLYDSLLGVSGTSSASSLSSVSTNLLLNQILEKLNALQESLASSGVGASGVASSNANSATSNANAAAFVADVNVAGVASSTTNASTNSSTKVASVPSIVRFRINGTDIMSGLSNIFVSTPETDGSFFVTGDRTYLADGKKRTETFYILLKAIAEDNNSLLGNYSVAFSVMQDYTNQNSFLYRMSQFSPFSAQKTGNLASIRLDEPNLKADILLQM